jgi:large subunit ribosomal protein L17
MPKPKKAGRFGGTPGHHNLMMANLATELIRHGRIQTTHAKAKTVQPLAERMITLAKRGDLHSRRQVLQVIRDKDVVHHLFADVGPAFSERNGGYTRVLKLGARKGDAAPMALIELVDRVDVAADDEEQERGRRRWSLRRRRDDAAATATAAPDEVEETEEDAAEDDERDAEVGDVEDEAADDEAADDEPLPPSAGAGVEAELAGDADRVTGESDEGGEHDDTSDGGSQDRSA